MNESIFIVIKSSAGELHVALPIIYFLKKSRQVNVIFVFFSEYDKFQLDLPSTYSGLIEELGECLFGYSDVLEFYRKRRNLFKNSIIMTCDGGSVNLVDLLHVLCRKSVFLFYHHAYALHGSGDQVIPDKRRFPRGSIMLLNSSYDSNFYKNIGFTPDHLMLVGAPGYSQEWIRKLQCADIDRSGFNKVVFVPLRAVHHLYLDPESYQYLIHSLLSVFKKFDDILFLVKFHPRQKDVMDLLKILGDHKNVKVVNCSTFEAASAADWTLSFWSSAITDSLACGTPSVEFYRHKNDHDQLISKDEKLISLYRAYGLCEHFSDFDNLIFFMEGLNERTLENLRINQYSRLSAIFELGQGFEKELQEVFHRLFERVLDIPVLQISQFFSLLRMFKRLIKRLLTRLT